VTVFSDGLAEYECVPGAIAVTLLRAVGELSRSDLPERPGHAGWPEATPEAQCRGPFVARFAVLLHGPWSDAVADEVERAADAVLLPLTGGTLRSALRVPVPVRGIELAGDGLAFTTAKESEDGAWVVLRCVNLRDHEVAGAWRVGAPLREARVARLDETPLAPAPLDGSVVAFTAAPRAVTTILVR
jgi:alpha-mannosidase